VLERDAWGLKPFLLLREPVTQLDFSCLHSATRLTAVNNFPMSSLVYRSLSQPEGRNHRNICSVSLCPTCVASVAYGGQGKEQKRCGASRLRGFRLACGFCFLKDLADRFLQREVVTLLAVAQQIICHITAATDRSKVLLLNHYAILAQLEDQGLAFYERVNEERAFEAQTLYSGRSLRPLSPNQIPICASGNICALR
jgi:hypothetical protein